MRISIAKKISGFTAFMLLIMAIAFCILAVTLFNNASLVKTQIADIDAQNSLVDKQKKALTAVDKAQKRLSILNQIQHESQAMQIWLYHYSLNQSNKAKQQAGEERTKILAGLEAYEQYNAEHNQLLQEAVDNNYKSMIDYANHRKSDNTALATTALESAQKNSLAFDNQIQQLIEKDRELITQSVSKLKITGNQIIQGSHVAKMTSEKVNARNSGILVLIFVMLGIAMIVGVIIATLFQRSLTKPISEAVKFANEMADGKLDCDRSLITKSEDEVGDLFESLKKTTSKLKHVVANILNSSQSVTKTCQEVAEGNDDLSRRTEQQAQNLTETAIALTSLSDLINEGLEKAQRADALATQAKDFAEKGGQVVSRAVESMAAIHESSNKIANIVGIIDEIAFQTNLLALNASVEAARAGEQGRGFAVVATEVRNLAGRSASAAKDIQALIQDSVRKVADGSKYVAESGHSLEEIVSAASEVNTTITSILDASEKQSNGISEINKSISMLDTITQQNSALVEEVVAASAILYTKSNDMIKMIQYFQFSEDTEEEELAEPLANGHTNGVPPGNLNGSVSAGNGTGTEWQSF